MKIEKDENAVKADILIEALPYFRQFNGVHVVVKYGGSAMVDDELKRNVIKDISLLKLVGMKPIIVHGGGKEITKWATLANKETTFYKGLRVTDKETMEIAEMVLSTVNQSLVAMMGREGIKAVGLCGKDGAMVRCKKKELDDVDLGYVGEVTEVDPTLLNALIDDDFVPVISPIGLGPDFEGYNINADYMASAIAVALKAEKLVFLTDIDGILLDPNDRKSLLPRLCIEQAQGLIESGVITGGMLPKINNCIRAIGDGVERVHILDGRVEHCLLLEFFTEEGVGSAILK